MQLNNLYFGKPQSLASINAFEGETVQGNQVLPGSQIDVATEPLILDMQPVTNASYNVCIYDQNDVVTQCLVGEYAGRGIYSTVFLVDARFHTGIYRVEGTVYGVLPNGTFIIFEEKIMIIRALPVVPLIIFALLILAVGIALKRRKVRPSRRRIRRRPHRKGATVRRRSQSRRLVQVRKRT